MGADSLFDQFPLVTRRPAPANIAEYLGLSSLLVLPYGFENYLRRRVCAGRLRLATARYEIRTNWVYYWKRAGRPRG